MSEPIAAVLWDFGGVITTSPFEAFNAFEKRRDLPQNFIRGINATNPDTNAWAQFEANEIDADTFDGLFAAEALAAGHKVRGKEVLALLSGSVRPNMVRVLAQCKAHYKIACITNNVKSGSGPGMASDQEKAKQVRDVMALFDLVVESSVEGVRKPNPAIYKLTCERVGVNPSACVFLDDLGINLKPAKALGMRTIKVLNEKQAIADLAQVTGLAFD